MPQVFIVTFFLLMAACEDKNHSDEKNELNKIDTQKESLDKKSSDGKEKSSGKENNSDKDAEKAPLRNSDSAKKSEKAKNTGDPILKLHTPAPKECGSCHEDDRPTTDHYQDRDCASCHSYPDFKVAEFSHEPALVENCNECHERPGLGLRSYPNQGPPLGFNPDNPQEYGSGHYVGNPCTTCHLSPYQGAETFAFSHSEPSVKFCLPCHYNSGQEEHSTDPTINFTQEGNCGTCHTNFDVNNNRSFDPD